MYPHGSINHTCLPPFGFPQLFMSHYEANAGKNSALQTHSIAHSNTFQTRQVFLTLFSDMTWCYACLSTFGLHQMLHYEAKTGESPALKTHSTAHSLTFKTRQVFPTRFSIMTWCNACLSPFGLHQMLHYEAKTGESSTPKKHSSAHSFTFKTRQVFLNLFSVMT